MRHAYLDRMYHIPIYHDDILQLEILTQVIVHFRMLDGRVVYLQTHILWWHVNLHHTLQLTSSPIRLDSYNRPMPWVLNRSVSITLSFENLWPTIQQCRN